MRLLLRLPARDDRWRVAAAEFTVMAERTYRPGDIISIPEEVWETTHGNLCWGWEENLLGKERYAFYLSPDEQDALLRVVRAAQEWIDAYVNGGRLPDLPRLDNALSALPDSLRARLEEG